VAGPLGFFNKADDKDKSQANIPIVILITLGAMFLGLLFTIFEHSRPLFVFRREAARLAKGESDQMQPSRFRGVYRKIASDLNDGIDQVAAKGGVPRRAADLKQVLGDIPAEPQMSAFSFPGDSEEAPKAPPAPGDHPALVAARSASQPKMKVVQPPPTTGLEATMPSDVAGAPPRRPPPPRRPGVLAGNGAEEPAEWRQVYNDFVSTKQQCGESIDGFTYEKFETTLKKNRDALVKRHGAARVKFSVYVKDGKAALKASPIKE
jgi:hypothetical protein